MLLTIIIIIIIINCPTTNYAFYVTGTYIIYSTLTQAIMDNYNSYSTYLLSSIILRKYQMNN